MGVCGDVVVDGLAAEEGPAAEEGLAVDGPTPSAPIKTVKPGGEGGVDGSTSCGTNCPVGLP